MNDIIVSRIDHTSPRFQEVWELREEVLRRPLGRSLRNEDHSWDQDATGFIAEHDGKVIGCVFLTRLDADQLKLRAMAVYNEWQGKGVGRKLVEAAEVYARDAGFKTMVLHARQVAMGFYSSMNYTVTSNEFKEVGIPHYIMEKSM